MTIRNVFHFVSFCLLSVLSGQASAVDTIKIAFIDGLSGQYADIRFGSLKQFQRAIAYTNANGGALGLNLRLVPLDDQSSVQQALDNLDLAIRQGIRYVTQGNNPDVSVALAKAIEAHNLENPGRAVLYLDYGDGAPQLDNEQCSFWHFRFDASVAMKVRALVAGIPSDGSIETIYLLNQDNPWGHQASREIQRALSQMRPGIEIVGDDLHPTGTVQDFSASIETIIASGADAIVTADRGTDLIGIMSAIGKSSEVKPVFIVSNTVSGVPAAIGERGTNRVTGVFTWHANIGDNLLDLFAGAYRKKHGEDWNGLASYVAVQMLAASMDNARSTDPLQVASVLEGLSFLGATGPTAIREDNHQLLQPLFLARLVSASGAPDADAAGAIHAVAGSGLAWQTVLRSEPDETALETSCRMQRPASVKKH